MRFYEVLVATMAYHGSEALTYSAEEALQVGAIVKVALRNKPVLAIVLREVSKPTFDVKPVTSIAPFPAIPSENLDLLKWMYAYYPAPFGAVVRLFVPPTEVFPKDIKTAEPAKKPIIELPPLTADQTNAVETIKDAGTYVLHGITGSGKSRVYVELTKRALDAGKSALILTPEIGLTAQLTQTFRDIFGSNVYVLHSQQTAAERRNIWYEILSASEPVVVIGPRSALFSPVRSIGLIVLDEAHDNAYKNESAPHYLASRVAAKLASLHDAPLVLGSATPSVEDYYLAQQKDRPIITMNSLAKADIPASRVPLASTRGTLEATEMVDMRRPESFTRSRLISTPLLESITTGLTRGEQSLLFLNRRGTANVVLCNVCGWQSLCPNCDLGLTYHGDQHELRCHICGYRSDLPAGCPQCGNTDIVFKSIGTKAVVDELSRLLPHARVHRFDTDAKKADRIEHKISSILQGEIDVIVGTQMVGKGLDLPKLTTVGIINADASLLIPDYTAAEQTYQLLSQVAGRVGRGHTSGTVIVQTYDPENATLQAALQRDWSGFYNSELTERKTYHYPPYTYLLKLRVLRASSKSAQTAAEKLAGGLAASYPNLTIDGPAASFHPRESGKYSWQLLLKSPSRQTLVEIVQNLPSGWTYDIDPINLL